MRVASLSAWNSVTARSASRSERVAVVIAGMIHQEKLFSQGIAHGMSPKDRVVYAIVGAVLLGTATVARKHSTAIGPSPHNTTAPAPALPTFVRDTWSDIRSLLAQVSWVRIGV